MNEQLPDERGRAEYFSVFALPTLIYAILFTLCLYENLSSITMPFFIIASGLYVRFCLKKSKIEWKRGSSACFAVMLLLGISDACTDSLPLIIFNNLGIFLVFLCMLLHSYCNDRGWTPGKYFTSMLTAILGAIGCLWELFCDYSCYRKYAPRRQDGKLIYVLIGLACTLPFFMVVLPLLSQADAVFASFFPNDIHDIFWFLQEISLPGIIFVFLFALSASYCGIRYLNMRRIPEECDPSGHLEPVIAITGLSLISVVYVFFCGIQIVCLFLGNMELPDGYTYARYAREGFFQLLFVCMINVALVLLILRFFRKHFAVKLLLTVISGCTYIMAAASAYRMILYIQNYHLTFLRILVLWTLFVIACLLLGILILIYREKFPLFRYGFVVICAAYLALSFGHPDCLIARYNLAQIKTDEDTQKDYGYLVRLSSDAASVMADCSDEAAREEYFRRAASRHSADPRKYNFSRAGAKRLAEKLGSAPDLDTTGIAALP